MQNVLLLAAVAAIFAFGWFLMRKLDGFFEENRRAQELGFPSEGNILRLGFCDPMAAGSITDALGHYSKMYPDVSVRIFCGTGPELLKGFSSGRFDVIFLPANAEIPAHMQYNFMIVSFHRMPVMMKYGGLPIEPIVEEHIIQNVLWPGKLAPVFVSCFIKCLEGE